MQIQEFINEINVIGETIPIQENFHPIFWSLIAFNLIIIALIQSFNPSYIRSLFSTAIYSRQLVNNLREDIVLTRPTAIALNFTYFNCLAIITGMAIQFPSDFTILVALIVLISTALVKILVILTLTVLANTKIGLLEHLLNHFIFFQIAGIILTPILISLHYLPQDYSNLALITVLIIIGIILLMREFQGLIRALQYKIPIFYIILYLCTLELLPLLAGVRFFVLNNEVLN